ncbi:MAG: hypothetical protein N2043_02215 [Ignavibacterium sp.]|nr:hypothetical protein [Ignavibacterium sp.]
MKQELIDKLLYYKPCSFGMVTAHEDENATYVDFTTQPSIGDNLYIPIVQLYYRIYKDDKLVHEENIIRKPIYFEFGRIIVVKDENSKYEVEIVMRDRYNYIVKEKIDITEIKEE